MKSVLGLTETAEDYVRVMQRLNRRKLRCYGASKRGWVHDTKLTDALANNAREEFRRSVTRGECRADMLNAALHAEAEDDALVSTCAVSFPVQAYEKRVTKLADAMLTMSAVRTALDDVQDRRERTERIVAATSASFFETFSVTSTLETGVVYENPGVYVLPSSVYISRVLIQKQGCSSSLSIILDGVLKQIAIRSASSSLLTVRVSDTQDPRRLPECTVLPIGALAPTLMNATPIDILIRQHLLLKIAFWPFQWVTSGTSSTPPPASNTGGGEWTLNTVMNSFGSGFADAAQAAITHSERKSQSAYLEAVSRAAAHRLRRGVWTTTGGGDLNRCIAVCERLCIIIDECDTETLSEVDRIVAYRDLAVLYFHDGRRKKCLELLHTCVAAVRNLGFNDDDGSVDLKRVLELANLLEKDGCDNEEDRDATNARPVYTELPW